MSKSSEAVKEWRRNTKQKLILCMGSKCQICDYNKSQNALEFHHIDPIEKDFTLSSIRANPQNWNTIRKELQKCILLCSNCHREVHEGITELPISYQVFDETILELSDNKHLLKQTKTTYCPVCNIKKENHLLTCSKICASKRKSKIDWSNIDLLDLIDNQKLSKKQVGEQIGCSDVAVGKRYRKLKLHYHCAT